MVKIVKYFLFLVFICSVFQLIRPAEVYAAANSVVTFNSISLYWSSGSTGDCEVNYRMLGSSTWKEGYPLWFDSRNGECRGSLVNLIPNTTYEIHLASDNDSTNLIVTTWNDNYPVDPNKIHYLDASSSNTLTVSDSGTSNGYSIYTPEPGKSITIDVQNSQNYVVNVNASYVIIRGLKLVGGIYGVVYLNPDVHDVVIENNELSNWGTGANFQGAIFGGGNYSQTNPNLKRIIIQRNKIFNPRFSSNDWSTGHPSGPQGIVLFNSGGNHIIRYNEIYSDNGNYYNDILGAGANFQTQCGNLSQCTGFPGPDTDIYGNYLANCWDDAIEADGQGRNVRIWENYIEKTYVKISHAGNYIGPLYIFRNVSGSADKGSGQTGGDNFTKGGEGGGRVYIFHNTTLQPNGVTGGILDSGGDMSNVVTRNNIFQIRSIYWNSIRDSGGIQNYDIDYDFYNGKIILNNVDYVPLHSLKFTDPDFATQNFDRANGLGSFYLSPTSGGYDKAIVLPNFNGGYTGLAPDMGAHEAGTSPMEFGIGAYQDQSPTTITPTPLPIPGDANGDGEVDGADYVIWLTHYNQNVTGPANGDFNNSGVVDGADYIIWLNNFQTV
ncbi:MAG: hypothetical protein US62_C0001G0016 [Candidatus Woesebacteria bacterium GW2011_GWA1_37_8]|uniref:Probable pectate lyase C n=2 Tax=Candidatus Woeseibacteriota TaxID=1752722 RepID=A0A0G0NPI6_9BACT|nr:MAG: hypothetical protein US62_C0001G0016 [Candidatus Woesebacteria bacterium GW2011_GWA1_37_8]KKQ87799.1 MAG: hypothetical protein UT10_C0001G0040 [Candidatus Woesebacteria bacterium GW2011_GWB1_38_8b]